MRVNRLFALLMGLGLILGSSLGSAQAITLKLAHQWPQDKSDYVIATAIKFANEVEKRSNGQIKIRFFPAESLVKAKDTNTALKTGAVDLSIYPYIYASGAIPQMNLVLLPGLWKSQDDVYAFRKTKAWQVLEKKAEAYGFKTLAWIQISGGVASTTRPVVTPSDVKGMKVRAAGRFMEYALQKAGASTVSMPSSDTYGAMQRGLLGAIWTSSSSFAAYRMYDVAKYYVSPENYSIFFTIEPIAISMKTWHKLTPAQQKILTQAGHDVEKSALAGAKAEDALVAKDFAKHGVKVQKMKLADWKKWQSLFSKYAFKKFREDVPGGAKLLKEAHMPAN